MWANYETAALIEWLREFNSSLPEKEKIGFYGMDVYGHWEALDDLIIYLEEILPDRYAEIKQMLSYFSGYRDDDWNYAREVASGKTSIKDTLNYIITLLKEESEELRKKSPNPSLFF